MLNIYNLYILEVRYYKCWVLDSAMQKSGDPSIFLNTPEFKFKQLVSVYAL